MITVNGVKFCTNYMHLSEKSILIANYKLNSANTDQTVPLHVA